MKLTKEAELLTRHYIYGEVYRIVFNKITYEYGVRDHKLVLFGLWGGDITSNAQILIDTKILPKFPSMSSAERIKMQIIYGETFDTRPSNKEWPEYHNSKIALPNLFKFLESINCKIEML